jgi:hypothetical protein
LNARAASSLALCVGLALAGCKPRRAPGAKCENVGRFLCEDTTSALYCNEGKYESIPCRGPLGCVGGASSPKCDDSVANEGEKCMTASRETYACAGDREAALVCKDGKWERWRGCKGPGKCVASDERLDCDNTIADVGDPCGGGAGTGSCSTDQAHLLMCRSGRLEIASTCRGPKLCSVDAKAKTIDCDRSIAVEDEPCPNEGELSCSLDGKAQLACKGSKWVKDKDCKRKDGCEYKRGEAPRCAW